MVHDDHHRNQPWEMSPNHSNLVHLKRRSDRLGKGGTVELSKPKGMTKNKKTGKVVLNIDALSFETFDHAWQKNMNYFSSRLSGETAPIRTLEMLTLSIAIHAWIDILGKLRTQKRESFLAVHARDRSPMHGVSRGKGNYEKETHDDAELAFYQASQTHFSGTCERFLKYRNKSDDVDKFNEMVWPSSRAVDDENGLSNDYNGMELGHHSGFVAQILLQRRRQVNTDSKEPIVDRTPGHDEYRAGLAL